MNSRMFIGLEGEENAEEEKGGDEEEKKEASL